MVALPIKVSVALGKVNVLLEAPTSATPARVIFAVPLLVPSLKTTETWNNEMDCIIGNIITRLVTITIIIKPLLKEIIYLEITVKVTAKKFIVPISNKAIEDNVSIQIELVF